MLFVGLRKHCPMDFFIVFNWHITIPFQIEMAHIQFTDTLVREYLVSRGFAAALKSFDSDVKTSRDHSFRVSFFFKGCFHDCAY